jgi:hypothetical protein
MATVSAGRPNPANPAMAVPCNSAKANPTRRSAPGTPWIQEKNSANRSRTLASATTRSVVLVRA